MPQMVQISAFDQARTSKVYSHQLDIEGHYNWKWKDKIILIQRCYWRHHSLPWHSILLTKTHGKMFLVIFSIQNINILLKSHFVCKSEQNIILLLWFPSLLWFLGVVEPNLYPTSRNSVEPYACNISQNICLSFMYNIFVHLHIYYPSIFLSN